MAEFFLEYDFLLSVGCVYYSIRFYVCLYFWFNNEKKNGHCLLARTVI